VLTRKKVSKEVKANRYIAAGSPPPADVKAPRDLVPVIINFDRALLERLDRRAKNMGLNRTAFVVNAAAEKLLQLDA
jgi:hypothetical protein